MIVLLPLAIIATAPPPIGLLLCLLACFKYPKSAYLELTMKRIMNINNKKPMNITGETIKRFREAAGMTQQELSAKLETKAIYICRGSLSRIENGSRLISDIELQEIADILQIPINNLFQNERCLRTKE